MLKKLFCAVLLTASCTHALAATEIWWEVTWSGFKSMGQFVPGYQVVGTFSGIDINEDNLIDRSELTSLSASGLDFYGCAGHTPSTCSIDSFSYVIGGALDFSASRHDSWDYGDSFRSERTELVVGSYVSKVTTLPWVIAVQYWEFTPQTQVSIMAVVPEPATYAMWGGGLLLLAGLANKKNRAGATST